MMEELRYAILCECIGQHELGATKHSPTDVTTDFKMARLRIEGGNEKELFKLGLKHGLRDREFDGEGTRLR